MTTLLLDTNVILDLVMRREPFVGPAKSLFLALEPPSLGAVISASAVTDIYYLIAKVKSPEMARTFLAELTQKVGIVPVNQEVIYSALASPMKDFEDAVQAFAAFYAGIDFLITRNTSDFAL